MMRMRTHTHTYRYLTRVVANGATSDSIMPRNADDSRVVFGVR